MGWLYTHKDQSVSVKDYLTEKLNFHREDGSYGKIIDCAIKNLRTAYMAYEYYTPENRLEVVGLVFLLDYAPRDYNNFGYKDMEESMGPCEAECPERILKLLTPTDNEYANKWRERCWENIRKSKALKLTKGLRIKFVEPLTFTNGDKVQEFVVYDAKRRIFADAQNTHRYYKIRPKVLRNAEIINPNAEAETQVPKIRYVTENLF